MKTERMHIPLDQMAPGLPDKLERLPLDKLRRIVAQASSLATDTFTELEPAVRELFEAVWTSDGLSEAQVAEARALAEAADERYFALKEAGADATEWTAWFEKARLLTALSLGSGRASAEDLLEAVYELCHSREDPSDIIAFIESEARWNS